MKQLTLTILLILIFCMTSKGQKVEMIYNNPSDSAVDNYLIVYPKSIPWKGLLVLVPSYGEVPQNVLQQTNLPIIASRNGFLTVIPTFSNGALSFGIDSTTQSALDDLLEALSVRHKLKDAKLYLGGFSIGGSCVVKYAERANDNPKLKKPSAVFAIDPPLDFERMYNAMIRDIRLSKIVQPNREAVFFSKRIADEFGGTPSNNFKKYQEMSPYLNSDTTQQSIKALINTPIRLITEPDIQWWLKERGSDMYSLNAVDCSAVINELKRLGNKNAVLITTNNKGYRKPKNIRHPHSWSIADPGETIKWLKSF